MIEAKDLRIGNLLISSLTGEYVKADWLVIKHVTDGNIQSVYDDRSVYEPIPLTEEILIKAGFETLKHMTVTNSLIKNIGRNRIISIGSVGTPNEMIWLCEIDIVNQTKITDLVCIRNYDYDGKTYIHQLQNLFYSLTGEELEINL